MTIVMAGTAILFAPIAHAGNYSAAISGCKAAISDRVDGDRVVATLGDVRSKGGQKVQLDFKVKVTTGGERMRMKARCLATRDGKVLNLTLG